MTAFRLFLTTYVSSALHSMHLTSLYFFIKVHQSPYYGSCGRRALPHYKSEIHSPHDCALLLRAFKLSVFNTPASPRAALKILKRLQKVLWTFRFPLVLQKSMGVDE
jgi:hypothetical protein